MTLDAGRMPGSKRVPDLDIGDNGEVVLELWCKGGKGQFSVAGNTVIFVPGAMENRNCPPDRAQADDDLIAALERCGELEAAGRFRLVRRIEDAAVSYQYQLSAAAIPDATSRSESVAPRDVDGLLGAATPGNRYGLRGAARHIGAIRRRDGRRISMGPVPGNIVCVGVTDVVRRRWRSAGHGFAIRWIVGEVACRRPEGGPTTNSRVMPERLRDCRTGSRRSRSCARRGCRPRERFVRGKHERYDTDRRDKRPIHSIRHGTHHFVGCREPHPNAG